MLGSNQLKLGWLPLALLFWCDMTVVAQVERRPGAKSPVVTNPAPIASGSGQATATNASASASTSISFETLAAFPIKVDWMMNLTNSALDTLRREGEIPALVKALDGKNVTVKGYLKPLKQDSKGVTEFLLMRNHALCCQTNVPQINEWIHVRMTGTSVPFAHERQFVVRGVLQVGELRDAGNVVSVYRLKGEEITVVPEPH
jgi:hypothetical protein